MKDLNSLELAFIGDSIHTCFVRNWAVQNINKPINELHLLCARLCSASWQAKILNILELNGIEKEIARRARNAKPKHHAKNADAVDYKKATAFEAVIGYLYVTNQTERLNYILNHSLTLEVNNAN